MLVRARSELAAALQVVMGERVRFMRLRGTAVYGLLQRMTLVS